MVRLHPDQHIQVIPGVVDRRAAQLLVIVPPDAIAAVVDFFAEAKAVIADFAGEEVKPLVVGRELFDHVVGKPRRARQEVGHVFLQIWLDIHRRPGFADAGDVVVGRNDIRKLATGQGHLIFSLGQVHIFDLDAQLILQVLPEAKLIVAIIAVGGAIVHVADGQYDARLSLYSIHSNRKKRQAHTYRQHQSQDPRHSDPPPSHNILLYILSELSSKTIW